MSEASDDPSGSSCPPPSLKMEERSECNDIYGRLTADPQEVEVGESVTLSWNVVCGDSDCVDRIGMFPEGEDIIGMMDYIDLSSKGLHHSRGGSVTWVIEESLFPCTETFVVFKLYTASSRLVAKSQALRVKNSNGLEAALESQQADTAMDASLTSDAIAVKISLALEPPAVEGASDSDTESIVGPVSSDYVDNGYDDVADAIQNHRPDTMGSLDTGKRHQLIRATLSGMALRRSASQLSSQPGTTPTTPDTTPLTMDAIPFTVGVTPPSPSVTPLVPSDPTEVSKDGSRSGSGGERRLHMYDILRTDSLDSPPHSAVQRQVSCPAEDTYASFSRRAQERELLMGSIYMNIPPPTVRELPADAESTAETLTTSDSHRLRSEERIQGRENDVSAPTSTQARGRWWPRDRDLTKDGVNTSGTYVQSHSSQERDLQMRGDSAPTTTRRSQLDYLLSVRYNRPRVSSTETRPHTSSSPNKGNAPVPSLGAARKTSSDPSRSGPSQDALEVETGLKQSILVVPTLDTSKNAAEMVSSDLPTGNVDQAHSAGDTVPVSLAAGTVNGSGTSPRIETAEPQTLSGETTEGVESVTPPARLVEDNEDMRVAMAMPAYKFITRPDLYLYLREDAPGSAGVDLLQNMDVLKMIQQIRADPAAYKTYSNKRRLVSELNKFAMTDCELPVGWTARKDKHGRVFYMDHHTRCTTYIDPRLPYPGHAIVPKSSKPAGMRVSVMDSTESSATLSPTTATLPSASAVKSFFSRPDMLSFIQGYTEVTASIRRIVFNIQTRSERFVEQYLVEDREAQELVSLLRDHIDHLPRTHSLPSRPQRPTPAPPPDSSEQSPTDFTVDEVVLFFSQENIYSIMLQKQSIITLSIRAVVETIRNNGVDGVYRLMSQGTDLFDLLEVFRADILSHGVELGIREAQPTRQRRHTELSPQGPLPPQPIHHRPRDGAAMMVDDYEPSIEDAVEYFKQMSPEELRDKQEFLSVEERTILAHIQSIDNPMDALAGLRYRDPALNTLLDIFAHNIMEYMQAPVAAQPRPSMSTGSTRVPTLSSAGSLPSTPAAGMEVSSAMPVAMVTPGTRGTAEEKLQFSGQLATMQTRLRLKIPPCPVYDFTSMIIRRHRILIDAYENIMGLPPKELKFHNVHIEFDGEPGIDYGGPGREFFFCVSHELFNPYYGLFEYCSAGSYTIKISPFSSSIKDNLQWFWFAGRFIGLAIIKNHLVDVFFARHIYKILLGRTLELSDLETVDPAFYNSLKYIRDNDPEDVGGLTFSVTEESYGEVVVKNLKRKGHRIPVTNSNKMEYIDLMVNWRLRVSTAEQSDALVKGFREIVPLSCIDHFKASELEWVIAGTPFIDVNDWKANTLYFGGYSAKHKVIKWFWKAVEEYSNEQRLKLLQFVTGTSSIPFEGFKALQGFGEPQLFSIYNHGNPKGCPVAHTCFNRMDLPEYNSWPDLFEKLTLAIEGTEGFGVV